MSGTYITLPPGVAYESNRIAFELLTGNILALKVVQIDANGNIISVYPTMYAVTGTVFVTGTVKIPEMVNITGTVGVTGTVNIPNMIQITGTVFVTGTVNVVNTVQVINTPTLPNSYELISAASTNATLVKSTPGRIWNLLITNMANANRYVKIYNKASLPVVGTDIPIMTLEIPATQHHEQTWGDLGYFLSNGIAFALTTGIADNNTSAVSAGDVKIALSYT